MEVTLIHKKGVDIKNLNLEREFDGLLDLIEKYLDIPESELTHYGVLGMKWGVRKDRKSGHEISQLGPDKITRKTKSGETITLTKQTPTAIHKGLAKLSKRYRDNYGNGANLYIHDSSGKRVGYASVHKVDSKTLNLMWLGIDKGARGKGYATAVMQAAQEFGHQLGFEKMTLEVPGNAADARHIYDKLGFKVTAEEITTGDVWGGLTEMEYTFDKVSHSGRINSVVSDEVDNFLAHYGVLGMKWGVRKSESQDRIDRGGHTSPKDPKKVALTKGEFKSLSKPEKKGYRKKTGKELRATRDKAIRENADMTVDAALRGKNNVLISMGNRYGGASLVVTGQEFVNHLSKGGLFDASVTQIHGYTNTPEGLAVKKIVDKMGPEIWNPTKERYVKKEVNS